MSGYEWYDLVGNIGVVMILLAYCMLQADQLGSQSLTFSLMNFTGAFMILVSLCFEFNLSAFIIEAFWLLISAYGMYKHFRTASAGRR